MIDARYSRSRSRTWSWRRRLALSLGSAAALVFAIHCGTDGDSLFNDGPCRTIYKGQCGTPCVDDSQCASGLHCAASGQCTAECAPDTTCGNGVACSPRGRCGDDPFDSGPPIFGGDVTRPDDDASPTGDACADIDVTLSKLTPTVMLLLDQSSSMNEQFPPGSGVSRWNALKRVLISPDGGLVKQLENDVAFGLALYSYQTTPRDPVCPRLTTVGYKLGNYQDIFNTFNPAPMVNHTPTAESIMGVIGFNDAGVLLDGGFARATTPGPKILILATDGDPDMCADPDSNGSQPPRDFTVWATARTYDAGIPTYVIAIGDDVTEQHQQAVANVGQGFKADAGDAATIYRTSNQQQLVDALNQIILGVRSCKFALNGAVVAGTETQGRVTLNGALLGYQDPNGWKLNSPTELELVGTACQTVLTSPSAQVSVRFPCGSVTTIPK
jgi:hypothetical protein